MTSALRDVDLGLKRFLARARGMQGVKATVGIHAEESRAQHPSKQTVGEIAYYTEFGFDTTRPVSFLRATIDEQRPALVRKLAAAGAAVLDGAKPVEAFGAVAAELAEQVRARVPVDTDTLRESVQARVDGVRVG
jgi:hypothetical protein